ncbi:MAG TPA: glutamine amidotransferase [Leptolyngbyaceae cyanobacterium M65_K2018_010]|nr:glutamine amidotransferase [Leptolyngbyaceae cyanobacterium M65_K2018_010]
MLPVLVVVHQATSNPGRVGAILADMGYSLEIRCPALGDPLPTTMAGHSAAVVFGGPMSANDDHHEFIRQELAWIPTVLQAHKPYLGICLGAQLLARCLGAQVAPHPEGIREIGYYPVWPTPMGRAFLPQPLVVYQWHQEGFDLPSGAHLLATGKTFSHQAFCYGPRAYGLQFHPEMTTTLVNHWTTAGADQLTCRGAQSRAHHISRHRLYRQQVEAWLRQFLADWVTTPAAETVWGEFHPHGGPSRPTPSTLRENGWGG